MNWRIILFFLSSTHEVFLETSFSTGFWLTFVEYSVSILYRTDQIIDIFSDKDLENKCSSFFQEYICDIENGKIEFDAAILIYSRLTCSMRSDI